MPNPRIMDPKAAYAGRVPGGETRRNAGARIVFVPWAATSAESGEWRDKTNQWNQVKNDKFDIVYYDPSNPSHPSISRASGDPNAAIYIRGHGAPGGSSLMAKVTGGPESSLAVTEVCDRLIGMGLSASFSGAIKFHSCYSGTVYDAATFSEKHAAATKNAKSYSDGIAATQQNIQSLQQNIAAKRHDKGNVVERMFTPGKHKKAVNTAVAGMMSQVADLQKQIPGMQAGLAERQLRLPTQESIASNGAAYMRSLGFTRCTYYGYLGPIESLYGFMDTAPTGPADYHKYVDLESLHGTLPAGLVAHLALPSAKKSQIRASVARIRV